MSSSAPHANDVGNGMGKNGPAGEGPLELRPDAKEIRIGSFSTVDYIPAPTRFAHP